MTDGFQVQLVDFDDKEAIGQIGAAIKQALAEQGKGSWAGTSATWLGTKAVEAINEAIGGVDLLDLFGSAWATAKDLQSRADPVKYPPGKSHYVKLGQHTVRFDVKPTLVISLGGWSSQPVAITLELSAIVNAMELKIRDGHITAIHGGSCDVGVTMMLGGKALMKRKTLKTFTLDVEHVYSTPGLRLTALDAYTAATPVSGPAAVVGTVGGTTAG